MKSYRKSLLAHSKLSSSAHSGIAATIFWALSVSPVQSDTVIGASKSELRTDTSLRTVVSVKQPRIYLGELAERLTSATGKKLRIDEKNGAVSGISLVVRVDKRPLYAVMESLAELLSSKNDRWEWQSSRSRDTYTLYHQLTPEARMKLEQAAVVKKWTTDVRNYHAIAKGTQAARSAAALGRPDLFPQGTIESGKPDLMASLTPENLDQILKGNLLTFDIASLSPSAQQAMNLSITGLPPLETGKVQSAFYVRWLDTNVGPTLWVRNSHGISANLVGGAGWDENWLQGIKDGWRYSGSADVQDQRQKMADKDASVGLPGNERSRVEWLYREAERQNWDLIADLVHPRLDQIAYAWHGNTREQTVNGLIVRGRLGWLSKNSINLFRDQSAAVHPRRHLVSWERISRLRQTCGKSGGYVTLDDLVEFSLLNPLQLLALQEEFPDLSVDALKAWSPVLRFYEHLAPEMRTRIDTLEGLPLREAGISARDALRVRLAEVDAERGARRFPDAKSRERASRVPSFVPAVEFLRDNLDSKSIRLMLEIGIGKLPGSERRIRLDVAEAGGKTVSSTFDLRRRLPLRPVM